MNDNFPYSETSILVKTHNGYKIHLGWKNGSKTLCGIRLKTVGDNRIVHKASPYELCLNCFPQAEDSIPCDERERLGISNRTIEVEQ